jgi:PAS domain S-box-containing protein
VTRPVQATRVVSWNRLRNVDPLTWSGVDKCLLWLGAVVLLYVFYLYRVEDLLAYPDIEPYFDPTSLRLFRAGLLIVTFASAGLIAAGIVMRRRFPENSFILHAANQIWWIWVAISAYAIGPVTTPVLGLVVLGGFVALLLFPRRVVLPALASCLSVLIIATVAERAELIRYAPLFRGPPTIEGRLSFTYVVVTSATSFTFIAASFALVSSLVERERSRERTLVATANDLERRVEERTSELSRSNAQLRHEAAERVRAESALRASEAQLRAQLTELEHLYENAPIGLALLDTKLRFVRINARLAAINGHPAEAHIGRTVGEMIPELAPTVVPIMRRVLDTGEPALNAQVRGQTPAEPETERHWLTNYYPLQPPGGPVLGVSAVVQDISEIRWAEQRAHQHLENLAHVARLRTMGEMATGIAHELNQPLTAIVNYAFIGRRKVATNGAVDPTEMRTLFEALSNQALRAGGIVQHLRAFVKKAHRERVATSVNALIGDVLSLVDFELRQNGLQPVLELADALPQVHCDTIQIQQVVLNLVRNALDAMASGAEGAPAERRLTITSRVAGDAVEVAVRDTGQGLMATDVTRVFDAFYTTKREGMGMGLAISRSIIEDHGGRLWLEANAEGGATFRFTLPVSSEHRGTAA